MSACPDCQWRGYNIGATEFSDLPRLTQCEGCQGTGKGPQIRNLQDTIDIREKLEILQSRPGQDPRRGVDLDERRVL